MGSQLSIPHLSTIWLLSFAAKCKLCTKCSQRNNWRSFLSYTVTFVYWPGVGKIIHRRSNYQNKSTVIWIFILTITLTWWRHKIVVGYAAQHKNRKRTFQDWLEILRSSVNHCMDYYYIPVNLSLWLFFFCFNVFVFFVVVVAEECVRVDDW